MTPLTHVEAHRWLAEHGDLLFAYALRRVREPAIAEDLVQETLLAALRSCDSFEGRSAERTWLVGILRNKLLDHWRGRGRADAALERALGPEAEAIFDAGGKWQSMPRSLPGTDAVRTELASALRHCMAALPPRLLEAFLLREKQNVPVELVAKSLGVTCANAAQLLHRARLVLRSCIEPRVAVKSARRGS